MDERSLPMDVASLRRSAATVRLLPPGPWRAVELSHLEVHGPATWDPQEDPDRASFDRNEQVRAERAAWRGLVDADRTRLVGEPLAGGSIREVRDPVWRFLASSRSEVELLLATVRALWAPARPAPGRLSTPAEPARGTIDDAVVERAARAAFEAVPCPTGWAVEPEVNKAEWRARARAVLESAASGKG